MNWWTIRIQSTQSAWHHNRNQKRRKLNRPIFGTLCPSLAIIVIRQSRENPRRRESSWGLQRMCLVLWNAKMWRLKPMRLHVWNICRQFTVSKYVWWSLWRSKGHRLTLTKRQKLHSHFTAKLNQSGKKSSLWIQIKLFKLINLDNKREDLLCLQIIVISRVRSPNLQCLGIGL